VREAIKRQALLITSYPTSIAAQDVEAIAARVLRTAMVAKE
jgi:MinD-like ATPase involved in chromosome partitioning or flagellar assembly